MKNEKHIIFSSEPDFDTAEKSVEEEVEEVKDILDKLADKSWLGSVLARACEKEIEHVKQERAYSDVDFTWDCEKRNLDRETGKIVIVADLGLWDGRRQAVKETGMYNLNAILENHGNVDDFEVYVEDGEVKGVGKHHDGTNYYTFREVIDAEKWGELAEKIARGDEYTKAELNKATKSLAGYVNEIYGWK